MSSLQARASEAKEASLETILHVAGINVPDQKQAESIMADALIGIATIASWRRPPVRFMHRHLGATLLTSGLLIIAPFWLHAWSVLAGTGLLVGLFVLNAASYKRKLAWAHTSYESFIKNERNYVPERVHDIVRKVRSVRPTAYFEIKELAQDPVLLVRIGNDFRYLAGWDGTIDLF